MKAQEEFCYETPDACMMIRICSYMSMPDQDVQKWYGKVEKNIKSLRCPINMKTGSSRYNNNGYGEIP